MIMKNIIDKFFREMYKRVCQKEKEVDKNLNK